MSKPNPPYYFIENKIDSDTYHWESNCSKNHYPAKGWVKDSHQPSDREQCDECKAK